MSEPPTWVSADDVQKMIDAQLDKVRSDHEAQIAELSAKSDQLQAQLDAARASAVPITSVPEHSGGPGTEIAPTWSQYEQEKSRAAKERGEDVAA